MRNPIVDHYYPFLFHSEQHENFSFIQNSFVTMQFNISKIEDNEDNKQEVLKFLRHNFFPNEPCAKALNLCPLGYQ